MEDYEKGREVLFEVTQWRGVVEFGRKVKSREKWQEGCSMGMVQECGWTHSGT